MNLMTKTFNFQIYTLNKVENFIIIYAFPFYLAVYLTK